MDQFGDVVDPVDGTRWSVDLGFLGSNWRCLWGEGCLGIHEEPTPELMQGCCSIGAELLDEDEAKLVGALGATLDPSIFEHHAEAESDGVFSDASRSHTRVVDGACIFFNHPGFDGGTGCALHLAALEAEESPTEWKPSVCWQLPLKVDRDGDRATLRPWTRADWGDGGDTMHWCCTETSGPAGGLAYDGDRPVIESMAEEIEALVGPDVAQQVRVEIRRRNHR